MPVMSVHLLLMALSVFATLALAAGSAPAAETEGIEESATMAQVTGDQPKNVAPYFLTPEMSDQLAFEQAVAAGNSAALIMFLARNPDAKQAAEARQLLAARRTQDSRAVTRAVADGDADVVRAFDAARLAGTRDSWDAFTKLHGGHPLAEQVQYFKP